MSPLESLGSSIMLIQRSCGKMDLYSMPYTWVVEDYPKTLLSPSLANDHICLPVVIFLTLSVGEVPYDACKIPTFLASCMPYSSEVRYSSG